jgi:proton-dependent oligopeptide transporter, POT family
MKSAKTDIRDHWLDYASEKYGLKMVEETKIVLNILVMYLPIPLFWALHAQQASRWVFQATKLDGNVGFYTIKPDQMIVLNSFLGVVLIPVFEHLFYPLISKVGINTSLRKITLGGVFAGIAFILAAVVESQIGKEFHSILWMFPQYLVMVMAEILIYSANLNFSYTEAPKSMKSVMMAFMYLTVAGGSLIVVLISGIAFFESQVYEFLFFAGIMFIDIFIFGLLATRYKFVEQVQADT